MIVGEVIYSILTANAVVDAVVGQQIYPLKAPQGVNSSMLIYTPINVEPENTKNSYNDYDNITVQITSFATSYATVTDLADKVRAALIASNNHHGASTDNYKIDRIFFDSQDELYDDETKFYQVIQDYIVHLKQ